MIETFTCHLHIIALLAAGIWDIAAYRIFDCLYRNNSTYEYLYILQIGRLSSNAIVPAFPSSLKWIHFSSSISVNPSSFIVKYISDCEQYGLEINVARLW